MFAIAGLYTHLTPSVVLRRVSSIQFNTYTTDRISDPVEKARLESIRERIQNNNHKKAFNLIFGEKKYKQFNDTEKRLVNFHHSWLLKEANIYLPNTFMTQEDDSDTLL